MSAGGPQGAEGLALGALDDLDHVVVGADDALCADVLVEAPAAGPAPAALLARLTAAVAQAGRLEVHAAAAAALLGAGPRRARQVLRLVDDPGAWLALLPTLQTLHLRPEPSRAGADVGMVRLGPDSAFPHHVHHGGEEVLVLEGSLRDEDGALHGPGAVLVAGPGSAHETVAGPEGATYLAVVRGLEVPGWEIPELPPELLR
ncbi:MAG: hypothetical protein RL071_3728 [Pseudomonadota bacterium]